MCRPKRDRHDRRVRCKRTVKGPREIGSLVLAPHPKLQKGALLVPRPCQGRARLMATGNAGDELGLQGLDAPGLPAIRFGAVP